MDNSLNERTLEAHTPLLKYTLYSIIARCLCVWRDPMPLRLLAPTLAVGLLIATGAFANIKVLVTVGTLFYADANDLPSHDTTLSTKICAHVRADPFVDPPDVRAWTQCGT